MAKQTGFPGRVLVDDVAGAAKDISNDINSFELSTPSGMQDITGLDKSAIERLLLRADGKVSLKGTFNDAVDKSHDIFRTIATARTVARTTLCEPSGVAAGAPRLSMELLYSSYSLSRGDDGSLTWTAEGELQDGTVPTWGVVP
jgi:hypothetical protein